MQEKFADHELLNAQRTREREAGSLLRTEDLAALPLKSLRPPRAPSSAASASTGAPSPTPSAAFALGGASSTRSPTPSNAVMPVSRPPSRAKSPRSPFALMAAVGGTERFAPLVSTAALPDGTAAPVPAQSSVRPRAGSHGPRIQGAFRSRALTPRSVVRPISRDSSADRRKGEGVKDFVAENRANAGVARWSSSRPRSADEQKVIQQLYARDASNVPRYLEKIKRVVAAEQLFVAEHLGLNKNRDGLPAGHRLLSEAEKSEILDGLRDRKAVLDVQHLRLPMNISSEPLKRRACELERELREVERNIDMFSRKKVLIKE
eukprot:gnl/TRDRNA2_/TRDRNA2_185495_c0_seq1.p1 gnl/TRDRNA2_/TRDRNA2_185495_c0~~gnl/TRDRNA2_/TRDRNA2_185495_c0_seq1.p1  ORF type:complete len:320 (+),score=53.11 gnl/TRDRNA2_/TRDRNA2_185495_c0_seq1:82-1041(+)